MHTNFCSLFFSGKKNKMLCILKGISPIKMHKFIFFPENLEKNYRFHQLMLVGSIYPNYRYFLFGLIRVAMVLGP